MRVLLFLDHQQVCSSRSGSMSAACMLPGRPLGLTCSCTAVCGLARRRGKREEEEEEGEDEWALPEGCEPFLAAAPLYTDTTAAGVALLWAPRPFNLRSGRMRRACDVPLVNQWFMEVSSGLAAD